MARPSSVAGLIDRGFVLATEEHLRPGECLRSRNRRFTAFVSTDGQLHLCITATDGRIMSEHRTYPADARPAGDYYGVIQGDGNFCLYAGNNASDRRRHIWGALTAAAGKGAFFALVEDDGNFSVGRGTYQQPIGLVWTSNTRVGIPPDLPPVPTPGGNGNTVQVWNPDTLIGSAGERITLTAATDEGKTVTQAKWLINGARSCVTDYVQTLAVGEPRPLGPGEKEGYSAGDTVKLDLVACRGGEYPYTMWGHVATRGSLSPRIYKNGTFRILVPQITAVTARFGAVGLNRYGGIRRLQFGRMAAGHYGFAPTVTAVSPAGCDGRLGCIQLVNSTRRWTFWPHYNRPSVVATTAGQWYLDSSLPYGSRRGADPTQPIVGGAMTTLALNDSPGIGLRDSCVEISVDEQFRMYVCFKPTGQNTYWVPLRRIDWRWRATVARGQDGQWGEPTDVDCTTDATYTDIPQPTELPTWADNIQSVRAQAENLFPSGDPRDNFPDCPAWLYRSTTARVFRWLIAPAAGSLPWLLPLLGPSDNNDQQGAAIWTSPELMADYRELGDLSGLRELTPEEKMPLIRGDGARRLYAEGTRFEVDVAPQCFFTNSAEDQTILNQVAPLTLLEVGMELVQLATKAGLSRVSIRAVDHHRIELEFPTPPTLGLLRTLAAHPQLRFLSIRTEFRIDDPPGPRVETR